MKLYNGLEIPNQGLGTFLMKQEEAYNSVLYALSCGYRLIDTAAIYENEGEVGRAIADSKVSRKDIIVSTKLLAKKRGFHTVVEECKKSIERLGLSYLDIFFIHWMPRNYEELLDTWRGMEYLYDHGYCKAIGVCNVTLYFLDKLMREARIKPMVCQIECHPFLQQDIFIEYCQKNNICVMSYGMFAKGLVFKNECLKDIALKNNISVANLVLSWGLTRNLVVLSKSAHQERIVSNFEKNRELTKILCKKIGELNDGLRVYRDPENNPYV